MRLTSVFSLLQEYFKSSAFVFFAAYLNFAAPVLNDPFDHIQTDAGAFYVFVEAFEHHKQLVKLLLGHTQTVIGEGKQNIVVLHFRADMYFRRSLRVAVFDAVADQVVKNASQVDAGILYLVYGLW